MAKRHIKYWICDTRYVIRNRAGMLHAQSCKLKAILDRMRPNSLIAFNEATLDYNGLIRCIRLRVYRCAIGKSR